MGRQLTEAIIDGIVDGFRHGAVSPGHRLDYGTAVVSGPPDVVRTDPRVLDAYLGTAEDDDDIPIS
jgi:hypothetical protein